MPLGKAALTEKQGKRRDAESRNDRWMSRTFPEETVGVIDNRNSVTAESLRGSEIVVFGYPNAVTSEPSAGRSTVSGRRLMTLPRAVSFLGRRVSTAISVPTQAEV